MTNYKRGVRKERQLIKELETAGYAAMRTAGSHGLFDVIAIRPPSIVRLIQVKRGKTESAVRRDCELAEEQLREHGLTSSGSITVELRGWLDNQGWIVQRTI